MSTEGKPSFETNSLQIECEGSWERGFSDPWPVDGASEGYPVAFGAP